jgi:hypothetical protein
MLLAMKRLSNPKDSKTSDVACCRTEKHGGDISNLLILNKLKNHLALDGNPH